MPELEQIRCQRGQVLLDADSSLDHVFFPDSGVVSVVAVYADGSVIEMATILVSVACNGAHSLKQRLARWLLMMRDRSDGEALPITQSLLAEMLGVQKPTITNAARELERAGLIARGRRQVTILDRQGLIQASCECYQSGPDARRFSPSQNIHVKNPLPSEFGNVHYRQQPFC